MRQTVKEAWHFEIVVTVAEPCRIGLKISDRFECDYTCPAGFCPKAMAVLHSLCGVARSGGSYLPLGGVSDNEIDFCCADGVVKFHLTAKNKTGESYI